MSKFIRCCVEGKGFGHFLSFPSAAADTGKLNLITDIHRIETVQSGVLNAGYESDLQENRDWHYTCCLTVDNSF